MSRTGLHKTAGSARSRLTGHGSALDATMDDVTYAVVDESSAAPSSTGNQKGPNPHEQEEAARYIAQIAIEMSRMAGAARLDTLAYLLSMAHVEAEMAARQLRDGFEI